MLKIKVNILYQIQNIQQMDIVKKQILYMNFMEIFGMEIQIDIIQLI
jgi:hypothetical protein